ncbi:hypothetical protein FJZ28_00815 [Candidatus Peregrinibacteria bacterium]|nr:hypothetical protein [Candidatus Peregrinibacteria bacterium]
MTRLTIPEAKIAFFDATELSCDVQVSGPPQEVMHFLWRHLELLQIPDVASAEELQAYIPESLHLRAAFFLERTQLLRALHEHPHLITALEKDHQGFQRQTLQEWAPRQPVVSSPGEAMIAGRNAVSRAIWQMQELTLLQCLKSVQHL